MESARRNATYDDVLAAPEYLVAQLVDGDLYLLPHPAMPHVLVTSVLGVELGGPFHLGRGGPGGWWILDEPELHLGGAVVVPDLAGWRRQRLPALPSDSASIAVVPDWIGEVLAPSTALLDRTRKLALYGREGVQHLGFVGPSRARSRSMRPTTAVDASQ